jgi:hypothetical protein
MSKGVKTALKSKKNPLSLTQKQKQNMSKKIKMVSEKNTINLHSKTLKKYKNRNSPPYPANKNCNKEMIGNDGNRYISKPNINNVCSWKKI